MIEFYNFSGLSRILITFLLGISVLSQTVALLLNFYRSSLNISRIFENLLEVAILFEILVFSLLHGQVMNGYEKGFVVPTGYENLRILIFCMIVIILVVICVFTKTLLPFRIIPTTMISLPIVEKLLGAAFPWFFISVLIYFLIRSIKVCLSSIIAIRTNISALSVVHAIDMLDTGVLFSEKNGHILLSNRQMHKLMFVITGKVYRNAMQFYEILISDHYKSRYKKVELDGQMVYLLNDGTAWMFTKTDILFRKKTYIHVSVADVSELWGLTVKLQLQNQQLSHKSEELKETIANLHILSEQKEIERAKMRAHDILGQRLSVLLGIIQNEKNLDYDILRSLSKGLLEELKAKQSEKGPYDELKNIQQIFAAIGVDIKFEGQLPNNSQQAYLFVDIIRESSTNAVRHGFATQINIKVELAEGGYNLIITNNGHTTRDPIIPGGGIGVMRKKANAQRGELDIIHYPLFTLTVFLPGGDPYE